MEREENYSFIKYLEQNEQDFFYYSEDKKNRGIYITPNNKTDQYPIKIANAYPKIKKLDLINRSFRECEYEIEYSLSNQKKREGNYSCDVKFIIKNNILSFIDLNFLSSLEKENVEIYKMNIYQALCRRYFQYFIISDILNSYYIRIGWKTINGRNHFISVTTDGGWSDNDKSIFGYIRLNDDGKMNYSKRCSSTTLINQHTKGETIIKTEEFQVFFQMLDSNRDVMGIFCYTLYSLLLNYSFSQNIDFYRQDSYFPRVLLNNFIFSICIFGKKTADVRCIANIFSNVFHVDMKKDSAKKGNHDLSATTLKPKLSRFMEFESIPIIVTSKTALTRNSTIVKRLHQYRERGKLKFFPVYLCNQPMNADEILDFNIENIIKHLPEKNNLQLLKDEVSYLLSAFISFLSKISSTVDSGNFAYNRTYIDSLFFKTIDDITIDNDIDMDNSIYFVLLYTALKGFCHFLKSDLSLDISADKLEKQAYTFFFTQDSNSIDSINISQIDEEKVLFSFWNFLQAVCNTKDSKGKFLAYIDMDNGKSYGQECYHLSFNSFFKCYKKFLNEDIQITESALKNILKSKKLLVLRKNEKQLNMSRRINGKLTSLLIIKKEEFDQLIKQNSSGQPLVRRLDSLD